MTRSKTSVASLLSMALVTASVAVGAVGAVGCVGASTPEETSETGDALSSVEYENPVIPMAPRPPGVSSGTPEDTEGCPDPMGLKTSSGEFYIFCTSYTWAYSRYDGFPIYKSSSLGGNAFQRVGSIIEDTGSSRSSWPTWIKDSNGKKQGNFWAPDVHELPNHKFMASYAAPCGAHQCVGIGWADSPAGPWTLKKDAPFVNQDNNGAKTATNTYDGNLLVASDGSLYFYWVVGGSGIWGAQVTAKSTGEIEFAKTSPPVHISHHGEGAYMIEHDGTFFLFSSTGGLYYGYNLSVRRGATPLTPHLETCSADSDCDTGVCESGLCEGRPVITMSPNAESGKPVEGRAFVATGGNSVIQNAVNGQDFMVYHAIVVPESPDSRACPRTDATHGDAIVKWSASDPYCRTQGDRQAMIDPITWIGSAGDEWPTVRDGHPSTGTESLP